MGAERAEGPPDLAMRRHFATLRATGRATGPAALRGIGRWCRGDGVAAKLK